MTGESDVHALDDRTVERIAAGEVVERPASVVKELVENSLDAGASRVDVTVERGGTDLVRVRDDGEGMTEGALRKAVRKHTTSKIEDITDLESGVGTLGFRGEALHTIGAVASVAITTKPRADSTDGDDAVSDVGTKLHLRGGTVESVDPCGCPAGTTVEVTDLFYNTPARKQYLKTDRTEFARVNDVVTKYALANPAVAVTLTHDGRDVFATPGQGDLQAAIMAVYGRAVAEGMIELDRSYESGPLSRLSGYVSHPETTRSSRDYVSTFVNGRYVRSPAVRDAIVSAYGTQLAPDRYPFAVCFLTLPPGDVDVNVHPRKMEVRFADEELVGDRVESAVRETLLDHGLVRSGAPRGTSAPEETQVSPTPNQDASGADVDADQPPAHDGWLDRVVDEAVTDDGPRQETGTEGADGATVEESSAGVRSGTGSSSVEDRSTVGDSTTPNSTDSSSAESTGPDDESGRSAVDSDWIAGSTLVDASTRPAPGRKFSQTEQRTLDGDTATPEREFERLPPLRVLGQFDETYVVAAAPDGLVLVDQHAADERVNYERLREQFAGDTTSQALASPVSLELTAGEAAVFDEVADALSRLGFRAERTGDRTVDVLAVPVVISDVLDPALLRDVLSRALTAADDADVPVDDRADALLSDLACYPSITGNTSLADGSIVDLLAALDDCSNPYACPHGRPTLVHLATGEIEDRFERDYPGHAGRRD